MPISFPIHDEIPTLLISHIQASDDATTTGDESENRTISTDKDDLLVDDDLPTLDPIKEQGILFLLFLPIKFIHAT